MRIRAGENPAELFDHLHALGLVRVHESTAALHETIAGTARGGEAITTATNEEARELNARIREARVRQGLVDDAHTVSGSDGLPIGTGDVIQTRRNDSSLRVANRQTWTVTRVEDDGTAWATEHASGRRHPPAVRLPAEYLAEHAHLAYAATAYGVQGTTVNQSHTVLSDALDAAGVYVGMTRGRTRNLLHVVAVDLDDAREQFTAALVRDRADRGLTEATRAAQDAITGLTADGPVQLVTSERARLAHLISHADGQAATWERAVAALARQDEAHRTEHAEHQQVVAAADARVVDVRAAVAAPLIAQAAMDGTAYLTAREWMWQANAARDRAGRLRKRAAQRLATEAAGDHHATEGAVRQRWGGVPQTTKAVPSWAEAVAHAQADTDARVIAARREADQAHRAQRQLAQRHADDRSALRRRLLGNLPSTRAAEARAAQWRTHADQARRELAEIDALPITEAAQLLRERAARAATEAAWEAPEVR